MNLEYKNDPASFANRIVTQADFTYTMTLDLVKIVDMNLGNKSVTNDIENVLRKDRGLASGFFH